MSRRLIVGLSAATTLVVAAVPAASASPASVSFPSGKFPLGNRVTPARTQMAVAPGIDLFRVKQGKATEGYTVTVLMPNGNAEGSVAAAQAKAAEVEAAGLGLVPSVQTFVRPAVADDPAREYATVRVGLWTLKQKAKADKVVKQLKEAGIRAKTDYLGDDGFETTGPWDMRVLMVDPRVFRGSYAATLGKSVAKRETTSSMAKLAKGVAAINGGFFNIHTAKNLQGDPTGISVVRGKLLSEAVEGRSAVILKGRSARITELSSTVTAVSGAGARTPVQGVNRAALPDELVAYTEEFGQKTAADGGTEVVVDAASGIILRTRAAGAAVPRGTWVLHGTGVAAEWLAAYATDGGKLTLQTRVIDLRTGKAVPLTPDTHVMGGGVGLVRNGKVHINAKVNGHASVNMVLRRHPRTLLGVTKSGGLILATVDGRKPGITVGASMTEAAQLMRWLGAKQAISLDGGGSTAMVVRGKVVNMPSDGSERAVGDALVILPR
ncbi:exopolysaccharide biosynthesis protein [Thermocatellispora tengchongensis]|uniref:Exopolysaccharide biosynthesis protein n=1 Tax=Thermocatellispora tengchongensis TaxID=1073253 RepID=A0A840P1S2_9ACTN|nr:phosphodiester glycosidase family protein [Thermocatellispora tengchongensis]MBB5133312.1 exopolysaccharide biosynthesis protein [Thermocatellispora tengchongensis]